MSVYIRLFHGRKTPDEQLDDWGTDGPVFEADFVHTTYAVHIKMGYQRDIFQELFIMEDMIYYDGIYYGDWSVFGTNSDSFPITQYDESKAHLPKE